MKALDDIANTIAGYGSLFVDGGNAYGLILPTEYVARYNGFLAEALSIIDDALGVTSRPSAFLARVMSRAESSVTGGPSKADLQEALELIRTAGRTIKRTTTNYEALERFGALILEVEGHAETISRHEDHPDGEPDLTGELRSLLIEAQALVAEYLGRASPFYGHLHPLWTSPSGKPRAPNLEDVSSLIRLLGAAQRQLARTPRVAVRALVPRQEQPGYVNETLIDQLREFPSKPFDFTRLIEMCRSLNIVYRGNGHMVTAMIVRTIANHIAPIFGQPNFTAVVNSYAKKGTSFQRHMERLDHSLKHIADRILHDQIRPNDPLPPAEGLDFRGSVQELLAEVIRHHKTQLERASA